LDRQSILIGVPKLFIGGKVSEASLAPQPTVNNCSSCESCQIPPF